MLNNLDKIVVGDIIKIQAHKYNGLLYRQWNGAKVIENQPEHVVLALYKTKVSEGTNQHWVIREPTLWFFPKNDFYNASILLREPGNFVYSNLASPPLYEDNVLKFIDFDLDIKVYPSRGFNLVDVRDFKRNSENYGYDEKLKKIIKDQVSELEEMYKDHEYIFNNDLIESYVEDLKRMRLIKKSFRSKKFMM